jgi:hypothetical protein
LVVGAEAFERHGEEGSDDEQLYCAVEAEVANVEVEVDVQAAGAEVAFVFADGPNDQKALVEGRERGKDCRV